jgi:chromosome segregation ATPase
VAQKTLEERVVYLEGKVEEHSRGYADIRERLTFLDQKVDRFREELAARIDALDQKVDRFREELAARIDALDQRLSGRIDALDQRLSGRIDALDQKVSRQFIWLVGIQITVLVAVVGALIAALFRG